jgi:hypothetical protein
MICLRRLTAQPKCGALLGNYPKWLVVLLFVAIALIEGPDFKNRRVPLGRISVQPMLSEGSVAPNDISAIEPSRLLDQN